jgi:LETM1 and EF-hand domain-containing protein 1
LYSANTPQLDETELQVSGESTYKQRLEVLQQQQELIEDEEKQEQVSRESQEGMA